MFPMRVAHNSGPVSRLATVAVCAAAVCRSAAAATRNGDSADGAPILFGLIGLAAAASAVSVWLVGRTSSTRPRSGDIPQGVRNPDQAVFSNMVQLHDEPVKTRESSSRTIASLRGCKRWLNQISN